MKKIHLAAAAITLMTTVTHAQDRTTRCYKVGSETRCTTTTWPKTEPPVNASCYWVGRTWTCHARRGW
jgi:hypothetical protein